MPQLADVWDLEVYDLGRLTNSVQLGFICGTLTFILAGLSDKYDPSKIVFTCCLIGALANSIITLDNLTFEMILLSRLMVGFCLAGIYPIGMKLIISWSRYSTSTYLSLLVGMLTLGTALPHLIRMFGVGLDWKVTILASSILACLAGLLTVTLGSGPYLNFSSSKLPILRNLKLLFSNKDYVSSALGYFGHMWELYAFWACVPLLLFEVIKNLSLEGIAGFSFIIIGIGSLGCFFSGTLSRKFESPKIAALSLFISGLVCLIYPIIPTSFTILKFSLLLIWGFFVISDSPLYSSISAQAVPKELTATALVIQNCIGFSISMVSISICSYFFHIMGDKIAWILLPGPIFGLFFFYKLIGKNY